MAMILTMGIKILRPRTPSVQNSCSTMSCVCVCVCVQSLKPLDQQVDERLGVPPLGERINMH